MHREVAAQGVHDGNVANAELPHPIAAVQGIARHNIRRRRQLHHQPKTHIGGAVEMAEEVGGGTCRAGA